MLFAVNKALCCHFSTHNFHYVLLNHFHALIDEYVHCSNGNGLRIYGMLNESQNAENYNYYLWRRTNQVNMRVNSCPAQFLPNARDNFR